MKPEGVRDAQGESYLVCNVASIHFWKDWIWAHLPVWQIHDTERSEICSYCKSNIQTHTEKPNQNNQTKNPIKKSKKTSKLPHMLIPCNFKSELLEVDDQKRGLASLHYWDFLAQNMELGPLSLSTESQQCQMFQESDFYPELHLGNLSVFSGSHRWPGEPCSACKTVIICAEAWEGMSPAWL